VNDVAPSRLSRRVVVDLHAVSRRAARPKVGYYKMHVPRGGIYRVVI
jgi:hypothetical protein